MKRRHEDGKKASFCKHLGWELRAGPPEVIKWHGRLGKKGSRFTLHLTNKLLSHCQPVFSSVNCNTVTLILGGEAVLPKVLQKVLGCFWHRLGLGQVREVRC